MNLALLVPLISFSLFLSELLLLPQPSPRQRHYAVYDCDAETTWTASAVIDSAMPALRISQ